MANSDANMDLRRRAVQQLGMMGRSGPRDTLVTIYTRATDAGVKNAAIEGLFIPAMPTRWSRSRRRRPTDDRSGESSKS